MKHLTTSFIILLLLTCQATNILAQKKLLVDVGHGQKFYSDPADKISSDLVPTDRLNYMTGELTKNTAAHKGTVGYVKTINKEALSKCNVLFIHSPGSKYSADEVAAIKQFLQQGGSLFIAMEEDYWSTIEQVNVNDIVTPFGITFKSNSTDKTSGGHSVESKVTKTKYSVPAAGMRFVEGGTPFAYSDASPDKNPFGVYSEIKGGGRIVAMGEGMVSLYMTSWQGVSNYQCSPFMQDVIGWLMK